MNMENNKKNFIMNNIFYHGIVTITSQRGGGKTSFIINMAKNLPQWIDKMLIVTHSSNAKMYLKNLIGNNDKVTILWINEFENHKKMIDHGVRSKYNMIVNDNIDLFFEHVDPQRTVHLIDFIYKEKELLNNQDFNNVIINTLKMPYISDFIEFPVYRILNEISHNNVYFFFDSNGVLKGECKNNIFNIY